MRFQLNDYVRVKSGVLLEETGEPVPGWEGQIVEVPTDPADWLYLLELDAPSLEQLPEKYLAGCIENVEMPTVYYFAEDDLEPAVRRDTDEQRSTAQLRLEELIFAHDEDELDSTQLEQWLDEFEKSPAYASLDPDAQESVRPTVEMFSDYAFNYRGDQPADWSTGTVREVSLDLFPRKISAEIEYFEQIGVILSRFFGFLDEKKYQKNASALKREMQKIAPEVVRLAKDPRNWGMAKTFTMKALDAGVNLEDTQEMDKFLAEYNANLFANMDFPETRPKKSDRLRPAQENPFKNISRNEIVRVKYPDGSILEGKFKRLEDDLRTGRCELLR